MWFYGNKKESVMDKELQELKENMEMKGYENEGSQDSNPENKGSQESDPENKGSQEIIFPPNHYSPFNFDQLQEAIEQMDQK